MFLHDHGNKLSVVDCWGKRQQQQAINSDSVLSNSLLPSNEHKWLCLYVGSQAPWLGFCYVVDKKIIVNCGFTMVWFIVQQTMLSLSPLVQLSVILYPQRSAQECFSTIKRAMQELLPALCHNKTRYGLIGTEKLTASLDPI